MPMQGLQDMYAPDMRIPDLAMQSLRQEAMVNQGNQLSNDQGLQNMQFQAQDQPFKLAGLGLENQTRQAQLPGIQATSDITSRRNRNENILNDETLKSQMADIHQKVSQSHIDEMNNVGTMFQQQGQLAYANPFGATARAKKAFEDAGHGDLWNSEAWDNLPPDQLQRALNETGQDIVNTSQQIQRYKMMFGAKSDLAMALESKRQEGQQKLRQMISDEQTQLEASREASKATLDKPTAEQQAVRMSKVAEKYAANGDDDKAKEAYEKANKWLQESRNLRAAGAATTAGTKVDIGGLTGGAVPTVPQMAPPAIGGAPPAGVKPPGTHSLAELQSMYPGRSPEELAQAYKAKFGVAPQ